MEQAKEAIRSVAMRSKLISSLMAAKESNTLKGLHGRLGDLGSIDPKYDVAISTAAPSLDHMVSKPKIYQSNKYR